MQYQYVIRDGRDPRTHTLDAALPWRVWGLHPDNGHGDDMIPLPPDRHANDYTILCAIQETRDERYRLESAEFEVSLCVAGISILVGLAMAACVVYFQRFDALTSKGGA